MTKTPQIHKPDARTASLKKAELKAKKKIWKHLGPDLDRIENALDILSKNVRNILEGDSAYTRFSGAMRLVTGFENCPVVVEPIMKVLDRHNDCSLRYAAKTRHQDK